MQDHCSGPRLAQDVLVLRPSESVNKAPTTVSSLASPFEITIQPEISPEFVVSQSSCLAPRQHSE